MVDKPYTDEKLNTWTFVRTFNHEVLSEELVWHRDEKGLSDRIKKARREILFYEENDNCPTCAQHLPSNLKTHAVEKHSHKIEEVNAAIDLSTLRGSSFSS